MSQFIVNLGPNVQTVEAAESTKDILAQLETKKMLSVTVVGEIRHYAADRVVWLTDDGSTGKAAESTKEAAKETAK